VCGRFTLRAPPEAVAEHFGLAEPPELSARYNIAPGQPAATIRAADGGETPVCELRTWGLVPAWAESPAIGQRMINARAETVAEKPAFRSAFRQRRCLIPADGFYEWASGPTPKQPYHIARENGALFGFAGLWEVWRSEEGRALESCTIVTTRANATLRRVHERMPALLDPADYALWLDPGQGDAERLRELLVPCPEEWLVLQTVGLRVNDPRNDDPECLAPAPPQPNQAALL
jgi:putative SOS response-associated peptidase YedK